MVQLRCTKKVRDSLGIKDSELLKCEETNAILGNWYVNIFTINRRKAWLFMNEKTLFSFVIIGVKKSNSKDMPFHLKRGLAHILTIEKFNENQINRVLVDFEDIEITKTNNRNVIGNMIDLKKMYEYLIYYEGGLNSCNLTNIILEMNRTPQSNLQGNFSIEKVKEILDKI